MQNAIVQKSFVPLSSIAQLRNPRRLSHFCYHFHLLLHFNQRFHFRFHFSSYFIYNLCGIHTFSFSLTFAFSLTFLFLFPFFFLLRYVCVTFALLDAMRRACRFGLKFLFFSFIIWHINFRFHFEFWFHFDFFVTSKSKWAVKIPFLRRQNQNG